MTIWKQNFWKGAVQMVKLVIGLYMYTIHRPWVLSRRQKTLKQTFENLEFTKAFTITINTFYDIVYANIIINVHYDSLTLLVSDESWHWTNLRWYGLTIKQGLAM